VGEYDGTVAGWIAALHQPTREPDTDKDYLLFAVDIAYVFF
jgi:hypothetical protein